MEREFWRKHPDTRFLQGQHRKLLHSRKADQPMISKGMFYTVLNGIAQFVKAISSLIINKVIVVFLGSPALLFVGNLKVYSQSCSKSAGRGIYEGGKVPSGEYKDRQTFILQACLSLMLVGFFILHCYLFYSIRPNLGPFTVG